MDKIVLGYFNERKNRLGDTMILEGLFVLGSREEIIMDTRAAINRLEQCQSWNCYCSQYNFSFH